MKSRSLNFGKFSLGVGDRFGQQAEAQLQACILAQHQGIQVVPVWNKSNREHLITGSEPESVRAAAAAAIKKLNWTGEWHIDADHIRLESVDRFVSSSDFFTIDVADWLGKPAEPEVISQFISRHGQLIGELAIPGIAGILKTTRESIGNVAQKYLPAVQQAGVIYRHLRQSKGEGNFITEISVDETDQPQTPFELLVILVALAHEGVALQTIAPKFTGSFHKGVDYQGNPQVFEKEFNDDLCVIRFVVEKYGLPANLKLSVHSGSDKFSLYPCILRALKQQNAGLHLKTAGTTWLEELISLAEAGGQALAFAKFVYWSALERFEELCAPYAAVIDIDRAKLPSRASVTAWTSQQYARALRHDQACPEYNPDLRQLLHVSFKIAAENRAEYLELLRTHQASIGRNVTTNLLRRHMEAAFPTN